MGQVFRATDTRLGRPVAIKISNEEFIGRFQQEARAIAALNHPNICTLYDVGPDYLVMELVDGETLAARLKRGKLSFEQTIRFGAQIAEALAAAHAKGIVHRDLKPGNVMLTRAGVKVLDFGLARSGVEPGLTAHGAVMGTPAYMAPEQLEGKKADARTDIYGLGLMLLEMATGKRSTKHDALPPPLGRVIGRCLEQDPDERWQSARDLKWELESPGAVPVAGPARSRNALLAGAIVLIALLLAALAALYFRPSNAPRQVTRVSVLLPDNSHVRSLAVSPDGRAIAMVLVRQGKQQIWVRKLDSLEPYALAGTDGAADPFWSPDSRFIGFFADARLRKIDRSGGPVQTLCDALGAVGATWNRNGEILIGALNGIPVVSDAGGSVRDLPHHDGVYPVFLPDGRHYLTTLSAFSGRQGIWLNSMDGPEARRILPDDTNAEVIEPPSASRVGAVLFTRGGMLLALPFDMKRLEAAGEPLQVAQGIEPSTSRWLAATSSNGVLAYVSGESGKWQYVWRDRQGRKLGTIGEASAAVMISPDGKQLADYRGGQIWLLEFAHGVATQLTFGHGGMNPVWSPDGRYVAYGRPGDGIYRKLANGAGPEELLVRTPGLAVPKSWSPDGRFIIYAQINPGTGADLLAIPAEPNAKPFVVAQSPATEDQGQFSPDGRWVAYTSNESGQSEIYVIPFPPSSNGGKWMVSRGGGVMARWARNSKELFYVAPDNTMMSVEVETGAAFHAGAPRPLFQTEMVDTGIRTGPISWDIAPDGKGFLIIAANGGATSSVTVATNWWSEVRK